MKRFFYIFVIFIIIFASYFIFIPIKINKTNIYYIDKYFSIEKKANHDIKPDGYFYSDRECGYFSIDNGITNYVKAVDDQNIIANSYFYIIFNKIGEFIDIFLPSGKKSASIKTDGYPYIANEYPVFIVLKPNCMSFSVYNINGNVLIKDINLNSIITSISIDNKLNLLISTIEGITYFYSSAGKLINEFYNEDSKIKITKSNVFSNSGEYFAICSGIYPEFIEIYKKDTGQRLAKFKTKTNFRNNILMRFFKNKLYYEGTGVINYYNFTTNKHNMFKINGNINQMIINNRGDILISTSQDGINYLMLYSSKGNMRYYKEFNYNIDEIRFIDNNIFYFKVDNQIIKVVFGKPV